MQPDGVTGGSIAQLIGVGGSEFAIGRVDHLEVVLVQAVDAEGQGTYKRLPEEPRSVIPAVDDVDAPEKHPPEKQAQDASGNRGGASDISAQRVPAPGKNARRNQRGRVEADIVGAAHGLVAGGGEEGNNRAPRAALT
jgi:hypothetical protein